MRVAFRCDASLDIGTGPVIRCLTLANLLRSRGDICIFFCRSHFGNLIRFIRSKGFDVFELPLSDDSKNFISSEIILTHSVWLGSSWVEDAKILKTYLEVNLIDWLIVDHYALDERWERALYSSVRNLMVIDDIADRNQSCDILWDQNLGRSVLDYEKLVPSGCKILTGPKYALIREEFSELRKNIEFKRRLPRLKNILISLGGIDKDNITSDVLRALKFTRMPTYCEILVVLGEKSPAIEEVKELATRMPWSTSLKIQVDNMAEIIANSDLAVGASGSSAWERCCLGLPSIVLILAENQRPAARALERAGASYLTIEPNDILSRLVPAVNQFRHNPVLKKIIRQSLLICDGQGALRVSKTLNENRRIVQQV